MRPSSTAFACLCLSLLSTSCGVLGERPVPTPPRIVEVEKHVPQPAACRRIRELRLPAGTSAQTAMEEQNRVIREYEKQIEECARP